MIRPRALALGACAALAALAAWARPVSPATPAEDDPTLLTSVRTALEARRQAVSSVRSDVVVSIEAKDWAAAGTCEGLLAAQRPGKLRLAGYAALATLFDTATDGKSFWVFVPGIATFFTGAAGRESLLTGLPVPPGQVVSAVFGEPYGALDTTLTAQQRDGKTWLRWAVGGGRTARARATLEPFRMERAELVNGDRVEATIDYRDYRKRDGVWWPTRIEFAWPNEHAHLALDFRTVDFRSVPPDSLFSLRPAAGAIVIDVDEEAPE